MKEKYFCNEFVEMWVENGILHIVHVPFATITQEIAEINVAARLEIAEGKTMPVFADVRSVKTMTKEARQYLSTGDGVRGISAGAFLIKTQIEVLLTNAWLALYPMKIPTRLFIDKKDALGWLEKYKSN